MRLGSLEPAFGPSPDRRPGWLLETAGNGRPRGMAITWAVSPLALQNPAYRPAGYILIPKALRISDTISG